jgi:transcription initiation factor TFIID subunit 1
VEERSPLIQNVGMASEVILFYRKINEEDTGGENIKLIDGTLRVLAPDRDQESPFIADVRCGRSVHTVNNNMYSAPIFQHNVGYL